MERTFEIDPIVHWRIVSLHKNLGLTPEGGNVGYAIRYLEVGDDGWADPAMIRLALCSARDQLIDTRSGARALGVCADLDEEIGRIVDALEPYTVE